jgi:selenide,water dikinase
VQTVDFFPPVVDDPWWYGRIAAANALSDVYAMGATPFSALNLVAFPTAELPLSVLATILQGSGDAVREAGAMLLGGHSIVDTGIKFGLAVTGLVAPGRQVTNAGAQAGDALYLTKPLGTGCLTTGARKNQVDEAVLRGAMESMGRLNKLACEAMVAVGVHAATDVTGYGLCGHAAEMALGSNLELVLEAGSLPLLPGAEAAMRAGLGSGGAGRTLKHLGARLAVEDGVDEDFRRLAADSETSGGLLIAVPPSREAALRKALEERGVLARRLGEARPRAGEVAVRLVR